MIKIVLPNPYRFATQSFLHVIVSARQFSQNVTPLLVNLLSNVTRDAILIVYYASLHMPNSPRKARKEFLKKEVAKEYKLGLEYTVPDPKGVCSVVRARM